MKGYLILILANAPALTCFGGAIFLAYREKPGWGWLILAGILTAVSFKTTSYAEPEDPKQTEKS